MFGEGLFIRNDNEGNACCVGDKVEIITEGYYFDSAEIEIPTMKHIGKLCLSKTKGVYLLIEKRFELFDDNEDFREKEFYKGENRQFVNLKMTKNTRLTQDWLLFNKKK